MGIRHHAAVGLLCVTLALTGCAGSSQSGTGGGSSAGSPGVPTPAESSPAAGSSASSASLVLSGQVEPGVEAGCLILKDAGKSYELMGGDPTVVKAGARVRVVGHLATGVMSHCMQGQPFQVTEAHAL